MNQSPTIQARRRKRSRKNEYSKPFNYNIIAWILLAALAVFVLAVKYFG